MLCTTTTHANRTLLRYLWTMVRLSPECCSLQRQQSLSQRSSRMAPCDAGTRLA
jgi:hypothetical protein